MKASQLTLAVLLTAAFGSAAHAANVEGDSSNLTLIKPKISDTIPFGEGAAGDLCKKAFPPTAGTQTQVFGCFRPQSLLILPKYPLNPPRIPHT